MRRVVQTMFSHTVSASEASVGSNSSCGSVAHQQQQHHHQNNTSHSREDLDVKKRAKREANRRSAQLSRARKKAFIEDLKQKNHEYQRCEQILACHPDMVFAFDAAGTIEFANARACSHLQLTAHELEAQSFFEMLTADSRLRFQSALQQVMSRPGQLQASLRFDTPLEMRTKTGDAITLDVLAQCTRDENEAGQWLIVCTARPLFDAADHKRDSWRHERTTAANAFTSSSAYKKGIVDDEEAPSPVPAIDSTKPLNVFALVAAAADLEPLHTAPGPRVGALAAAAAEVNNPKKRGRDQTEPIKARRSQPSSSLSSLSMAAISARLAMD